MEILFWVVLFFVGVHAHLNPGNLCMEQMMGIAINVREEAVLESKVMENVCDEGTEV